MTRTASDTLRPSRNFAASRKSVVAHVLGGLPPAERLEGTLAMSALAAWQAVEFLRVHDVRANLRAARMAAALRKALP